MRPTWGRAYVKRGPAISGQGKQASTRTLVAKESAHGIFFIVGRQKSDPGSDFSLSQVDAAKVIGCALQKSDSSHIDGLISDGVLKEICNENDE